MRAIVSTYMQKQMAFHGDELKGRIRLGVPDDYAAKYLTPVLKRFAPRYGGVEIELICEQSTSLIPRVETGDIDLALISRDNARQGTLLFSKPMVWVGSPQFELWRKIHSQLQFMKVQVKPKRVRLILWPYRDAVIGWYTTVQV